MNTQDPYSFIEDIAEDIYEAGFSSNGDFPTERRTRNEIVAEAKQRLISEFERVKKEARADEIQKTMKVKSYSGVVERYLYNRFNELSKEQNNE